MVGLLTDLDKAVALSGLEVIALPNWKTNKTAGGEDYQGVLVHHTGSYDALADADNDWDYAMWMAFEGRPDLPAPLPNLALSAELKVYLCAVGNANHAGEAKASGPMPAVRDGSRIYIGIEAMNSGSQGWDSIGFTANGEKITYFEGYARLCAALCIFYGWPASHVRGHKETSVTGKWDPGLLDMGKFRARIAYLIKNGIPGTNEEEEEVKPEDVQAIVKALLGHKIEVKRGNRKVKITVEQALVETFNKSAQAVANTKEEDA